MNKHMQAVLTAIALWMLVALPSQAYEQVYYCNADLVQVVNTRKPDLYPQPEHKFKMKVTSDFVFFTGEDTGLLPDSLNIQVLDGESFTASSIIGPPSGTVYIAQFSENNFFSTYNARDLGFLIVGSCDKF